MTTKIYKALLWVQGLYILLTALWALIDMNSFMAASGPKTDIWLVKTVSVILVAVALCLLANLLFPGNTLPVMVLAAANCIGLAAIDFYYALKGVIAPIYMLDGAAEIIFLLCWIYLFMNRKHIRV